MEGKNFHFLKKGGLKRGILVEKLPRGPKNRFSKIYVFGTHFWPIFGTFWTPFLTFSKTRKNRLKLLGENDKNWKSRKNRFWNIIWEFFTRFIWKNAQNDKKKTPKIGLWPNMRSEIKRGPFFENSDPSISSIFKIPR